jgi:tetratricopeptide (TPR) repeat protein
VPPITRRAEPPIPSPSTQAEDEDEATRIFSMPTLSEDTFASVLAGERLEPASDEMLEELDAASLSERISEPPMTQNVLSSELEPVGSAESSLDAQRFESPSDRELDELLELPAEPVTEIPPPPAPVARPSSPSLWPEERPGREHIAGDQAAWIARAEWMENEAHAALDPAAKARALIVASEVWALVGDTSRAREVATEASALSRSLPVIGRQARALASAEGDWKAVVAALEFETRGAPTPEARVHAAYLSAEVHRLILSDEATAKKKLELAIRAQQEDARAHVMKLCELLAKSSGAPRMRWPETAALAELVSAGEELARLRSPAAQGAAGEDSPPLAFDEARRALLGGDRPLAARALERLRRLDGLEDAATWLAAALLAQEAGTRAQAIELLKGLLERDAGALARRALAARALEASDAAAVRSAIAGPAARDAFSTADRVTLAALTGAELASESELSELSADEELSALAAAASAASAPADFTPCGSPAARSEVALGRAIAKPPPGTSSNDLSPLRPVAEAFGAAHPGHPLAGTLELEFALQTRLRPIVAAALLEWPVEEAGADTERDRALAAGLVLELGGLGDAARQAYERALAADPKCEAALRALLSHADAARAAERLEALAEARGEPSEQAPLLLEAALRRGPEDPEPYEALLKRAAGADPGLVIAYRLGEQLARSRGEADKLVGWLRARRGLSADAVECALDQVREALLISDTDVELAATLLHEAIRARPLDIGLRELYERLAPGGEAERGTWRESVAEQATMPEKQRLLLEAALEYGRAGDRDAATRTAFAAADLGGSDFSEVLAQRSALGTAASSRISEALMARAKDVEDEDVQRELYERLSELDEARGETSSALLWQSAILERSPHDLPALRKLEHAYIGSSREDDLEPVATALSQKLTGNEGNAHARLAARVRVRNGAWSSVVDLVRGAAKAEPPRLWALRALSARARAEDDNETALAVDQRLYDFVDRPLDKATLALRAAEAAARLERLDDARRLLERALEHVPEHPVALTTLAEVLENREDYGGAARALEALAEASVVDSHKVSAWHQAAVLWLEKAQDSERGRAALEKAVALDLRHEDAVARLQALYVAAGERQKLAELLERRLEQTNDPEERIAIEVARGRALFEVGERPAARAALQAALDENPDHVDALEAFAELCAGEGDWPNAEQAYIRLGRHATDSARQIQIYTKLGELYDTTLPNPERAELAYREVLKRDPENAPAMARLVQVYARMNQPQQALQLQQEFLAKATSSETRRDRTLGLALVEEQIAGDRKKAEATFERVRREWPHDGVVLRALAEFHERGGEIRALQILLERATTDARRALATGRFDPGLFETIGTVAELRGAPDAALVAQATLAALKGEEVAITGAGPRAADPTLDDLLAPDLLNGAFRALLKKSGDILDAAFPADLRALGAAPLAGESTAFVAFVRELAQVFAIPDLSVLASPVLGPVCMPVGTEPATLVFGRALLDSSDEAARYFLIMRSLKILAARASALSRTAPIELWPVLAAYLRQFAPSFSPQGVDARKLADAEQRLRNVPKRRMDDDVPVLALEVVGAIGNRASQVATVLHQWGNRTGLLAVGSPTAALRGLGFAAGQAAGPPAEGADRVKWVVRNPEARDLATFSVSEAYAEARRRVGI